MTECVEILRMYFKDVASVASLDKREMSITELTKLIATEAGYSREEYTFANGNTRIKNQYKRPFDNILVAKWLMYFKALFVGKLRKRPDLSDGYSYIIGRTFHCAMGSIDLLSDINDAMIHKYVCMSLQSRIIDEWYEKGNYDLLNKCLDEGCVGNVRPNMIMGNLAMSLEDSYEEVSSMEEPHSSITDDIIIDIQQKIGDSSIGERVLEAMLYSNRKRVALTHIDDFVRLNQDEYTDATKKEILRCWNIIKDVVRQYCPDNFPRGHRHDRVVRFSFERGDRCVSSGKHSELQC